MIFDPDAGKTHEQIRTEAFQRLPLAMRQEYEEVSALSGRTIPELLEEAVEYYLSRLREPAIMKAFTDKIDRRMRPLGADPRMLE